MFIHMRKMTHSKISTGDSKMSMKGSTILTTARLSPWKVMVLRSLCVYPLIPLEHLEGKFNQKPFFPPRSTYLRVVILCL